MLEKLNSPSIVPLIKAIPSTVPFVGPEAIEHQNGQKIIARLGANENAFGPAPSVLDVIKHEAQSVWKYGDPENYDLIQALAQHHQIKPENIMIGAGVDACLGLIVRQYILPNDIVINSLGGYPTFNYHVAGFGGKLVSVPYNNDYADLDELAKQANQLKAKIIYLANPDNPLGTWHDATNIERLIEALPQQTLLILDEAYGETAPINALPKSAKIWPNVLRMRTFSKAYGLAGLRCGYMIGHEDAISSFNKFRDHFSVNILAQKAALQALKDQDYLQEVVAKIATARQQLIDIANQFGLKTLPSATNFIAIDCGKDGDFAQKVLNSLIMHNVFVRKPVAPVINRLIRVSVGTEQDIKLFAKAFKESLSQAKI